MSSPSPDQLASSFFARTTSSMENCYFVAKSIHVSLLSTFSKPPRSAIISSTGFSIHPHSYNFLNFTSFLYPFALVLHSCWSRVGLLTLTSCFTPLLNSGYLSTLRTTGCGADRLCHFGRSFGAQAMHIRTTYVWT